MTKKNATILLLLLLGFAPGKGQDSTTSEERYLRSRIEQRSLDRNQWADLTEGLDYTEKKRRSSRQGSDQNDSREQSRNFNPLFGEGTGAAITRFLLIALGAIGIALLVRSILGYGRPRDKKISRSTAAGINIQKIEENIHEADLNDFIDQAKAKEDFNLAIRLYYLAILKELSQQKLIKWKAEKTNREYLKEMRKQKSIGDFRELTRIFERYWYGELPLNFAAFAQLEPVFRRFISQLTTPHSTSAQ